MESFRHLPFQFICSSHGFVFILFDFISFVANVNENIVDFHGNEPFIGAQNLTKVDQTTVFLISSIE